MTLKSSETKVSGFNKIPEGSWWEARMPLLYAQHYYYLIFSVRDVKAGGRIRIGKLQNTRVWKWEETRNEEDRRKQMEVVWWKQRIFEIISANSRGTMKTLTSIKVPRRQFMGIGGENYKNGIYR